MFQDSVRCIWDSPAMSSMLSDLRSQTHVCQRLPGCSEVRRADCGQMTATDDVLQTPTGTVQTGTMAPCRVSTGKPGRTVWTWCDHWRPASVERRVEDASDRGRTSFKMVNYIVIYILPAPQIRWFFSDIVRYMNLLNYLKKLFLVKLTKYYSMETVLLNTLEKVKMHTSYVKYMNTTVV